VITSSVVQSEHSFCVALVVWLNMNRVVSRLYTDYLPDGSGERFGMEEIGGPQNFSPKGMSPDALAEKPTNQGTGAAEECTCGRIFVARIPSRVSEEELRKYFEAFGAVEDAYRPRDFAKNTFRGIGFVTFADPAVADHVIATKHSLGGVEVVVDRATPKELCVKKHHSLGTVRQTSVPETEEALRQRPSVETLANNNSIIGLGGSFNEQAFDLNFFNCIPRMATYPNSNGNNRGPPSNLSEDFSGDVGSQAQGLASELYDSNPVAMLAMNSAGVVKQPGTPAATDGKVAKAGGSPHFSQVKNEKGQKAVTDNFAHVRKVRSGPRVFVGKISKDTVEQDLADYFSQFGFVMDVYIPRSRENKKEHRGFGFVTFETEAAIKRAISQGTHNLKGAVLAIDVAVPESSSNN